MKNVKVMMSLVAILLMAGVVQATSTACWTADEHPTDNLWTTAGNWWTDAPGGMPDGGPQGDFKVISNHATPTPCILDVARSVTQVSIADGGTGYLKVVSGGSLTTADGQWFGVGAWSNGVGTLEVSGGTVTTNGGGGHMWIGQTPGATGTLIINNGGVVNIGVGGDAQFGLGWDGGTGYAYIGDGLLTVNNWCDQSISSRTGHMDITLGTVSIKGYRIGPGGDVTNMIADGRITAYGGAGTVVTTWDAVNERTIVTAIPEPATICMLGFGLLGLLRRRK